MDIDSPPLDRFEIGRLQGLHEAKVACDGYAIEIGRRAENIHPIHQRSEQERMVGAEICAVLIENIIKQSHINP